MAAVTGAVLGAVLGAATKNVVDVVVKLGRKRLEQWKGLQGDIEYIKSELVMIAAEEEDQFSREGKNMSAVKSKFMEVMRDLVRDIEDFLDRISRFAESHGEASPLQRIKAVGSRVGGHPFATDVEQLKRRLKDAHQLKASYKVNDDGAKPSAMASATYTTEVQPVGIDKPKQKVLNNLLQSIDGRPDHLKVISIVGFGGSGKSTLAKAVCKSDDVISRFPSQAWVVASKHGDDIKGLLTELFVKLRPGERAKEDVQQLQAEISSYLSTNRYLIVLDDIKELQCWHGIKSALPEKTTSRIIVTTTVKKVARVCSRGNGYMHDMTALEAKDSKELLKAVLMKGDLAGLVESSTSILNKCDGHPLAVVAVANYLLTEDGYSERDCEELCRRLGLRIGAQHDAFKELCEVLLNSYRSLPNGYHQDKHLRNLKTCLLYLCVFPNGCHIRGSRLMRRWFAEKYVHGEYPLSHLDVAKEYFKELVDPNIIRAIDSSNNEEVKACRAHGIMHEFMLHMSTSAKFITSHENEERSNYRHLFIQNTSRERASKVNCHGTNRARGSTSGKEKFRAHSLTICGSAGEAVGDFAKCELLRVLDLEECIDLNDEHLDCIHELWFLRYLSLGGAISRMPREIENLHWLETLDMRKTKREIELPVKLFRLPHLIHLLGRFKLDKRKWEKSKPEKFVAKESNLQTVAGFVTDNNPGFPKLMTHMKKLRKVKVWCDSTDEALVEAIKKFIQVDIDTGCGDRSLTLCLGNSSGNILTSLEESLENSCAYLSSLKLHGALSGLTKFEFTTLLIGLEDLCLSSTNGLTTNELSNIKKLKRLKYLKLVKISLQGFVIEKWNFPRLLRLCLVQSPRLPKIQDGALQLLIALHILNQDLDGLSGIKMEQHTLLQELALDSEVNLKTKTEWENAATNHPMSPRVLYLKRVYPDGTDSMVKYVAANTPESETGSSCMQEERQIPTVQSVSVEEPSASLEHVNVAVPSVASTELPSERSDDQMTSSTASILVDVPGLQSCSPKEMKIHQEEKEEAMLAAQEDRGAVSSKSKNLNSSGSNGGVKHGKCSQSGDDHGTMNGPNHDGSADEDDGEYKINKRYNFPGDLRAKRGIVINETAVNGSNSEVKNTVTAAADMSCEKGKCKVDEIPENAIQVAKDGELGSYKILGEQAIREGVKVDSTW